MKLILAHILVIMGAVLISQLVLVSCIWKEPAVDRSDFASKESKPPTDHKSASEAQKND